MHTGTVKALNLDRGFGFISPFGDKDVFFHITALSHELEFNEQLQGRLVTFQLDRNARDGRPHATNIEPAT